MPTLAYKVKIDDVSIGFGSGQTLENPAFTKFVQGVDILILHLAVSEDAHTAAFLHAKPSVVGKVAQKSGVRSLVLSHFIKLDPSKENSFEFSLSNLDADLEHVKKYYSGSTILAEDLKCIKANKLRK